MTKVVRYDGPETFIMSYLASYFRPSFDLVRWGVCGKFRGPEARPRNRPLGNKTTVKHKKNFTVRRTQSYLEFHDGQTGEDSGDFKIFTSLHDKVNARL